MKQLLIGLLILSFWLTACGGPAEEIPLPADNAPATNVAPPPSDNEPPAGPANVPVSPEAIQPQSPVSPPPTPTEEASRDEPAQGEALEIAAASAVEGPVGNLDLEYAQVVFVQATQNSSGAWQFDTTVHHNDQGWDNYADAWQVVDLEGNVLTERILTHPHDNEQPFTRSQAGIEIPEDVTQVIVRAKDNVEGFGGQVVLVDLTVSEGENFEVARP